MAEFNRDQAFAVARSIINRSQTKLRKAAEAVHRGKDGLEAAIESVVHPVVVRVITQKWEGTGFYPFQYWFVSCAHVLPSYEVLSGSSIKPADEEILLFERAFIRPVDKSVPDIILVNTSACNKKGLPSLRFSGDEGLDGVYYFYTFYDADVQEHVTNFITEIPGQENKLPLKFAGDPIPGSSGAPVFKARVLVADPPQWDFELIGILYAYDSDVHSQLYVMPIKNDLEEVRTNILNLESQMQHKEKEAIVLERTGRDGSKCREEAKNLSQKANKGLHCYKLGVSPNCIEVDRLKLLFNKCKGIASLSQSMLLQDLQNKNNKNLHISVSDMEDLKAKFGELILGMTKTSLKKANKLQSTDFFRIDCHGPGKSGHWKLELQDNTGDPMYSQTFAIVTIPSSTSTVMGGDLAVALVHSALKKEKDTTLKTIVSPQHKEFAQLIKCIRSKDEIPLEPGSFDFGNHFRVNVCKGEEVGLWMVEINKNSTETQHDSFAIVITSKPTVKGRDLAATLVHSALKRTAASLKTIVSPQQSQSKFAELIESIEKKKTISLETDSFTSSDDFRIDVCKGEKVDLWKVEINENGTEIQSFAIVTTSRSEVTGEELGTALKTSAKEGNGPEHIY